MCLSRIAYEHHGLVGVDVKSHQLHTVVPKPVIARGNEHVDAGSEEAKRLPQPDEVWMPTGGFFAFMMVRGRMVTCGARTAVRTTMREQALEEWRLRRVQGKLASACSLVHTACLDARWYTACSIPDPGKSCQCRPL